MRQPAERRGTTRRVAVANGREIGQGRRETGYVATERRNVGAPPAVDVAANGSPRPATCSLQTSRIGSGLEQPFTPQAVLVQQRLRPIAQWTATIGTPKPIFGRSTWGRRRCSSRRSSHLPVEPRSFHSSGRRHASSATRWSSRGTRPSTPDRASPGCRGSPPCASSQRMPKRPTDRSGYLRMNSVHQGDLDG